MYRLHHQGDKKSSSVLQFLLATNIVPGSLILVTLMIGAIRSSKTSGLTRVTLRNIPEGGILHSHRREHTKSHIAFIGWDLYRRIYVFPISVLYPRR
jgi:hypothetical protein